MLSLGSEEEQSCARSARDPCIPKDMGSRNTHSRSPRITGGQPGTHTVLLRKKPQSPGADVLLSPVKNKRPQQIQPIYVTVSELSSSAPTPYF